jgi:hypothetical protein
MEWSDRTAGRLLDFAAQRLYRIAQGFSPGSGEIEAPCLSAVVSGVGERRRKSGDRGRVIELGPYCRTTTRHLPGPLTIEDEDDEDENEAPVEWRSIVGQ